MILMGAFCLFVCFPNLGLWISSETLQLFNIFPHLSEVKEKSSFHISSPWVCIHILWSSTTEGTDETFLKSVK